MLFRRGSHVLRASSPVEVRADRETWRHGDLVSGTSAHGAPVRLIVITSLFPAGNETFIVREVGELVRRGLDVKVISLRPPPAKITTRSAGPPRPRLVRAERTSPAAGVSGGDPCKSGRRLAAPHARGGRCPRSLPTPLLALKQAALLPSMLAPLHKQTRAIDGSTPTSRPYPRPSRGRSRRIGAPATASRRTRMTSTCPRTGASFVDASTTRVSCSPAARTTNNSSRARRAPRTEARFGSPFTAWTSPRTRHPAHVKKA